MNTLTMIKRSVQHDLRSIDALAMAVMLPVMILILFTIVFGGAIDTGARYIDYVVPGIFLLCAGFGTASTAVSVFTDTSTGLMDRFRSLPIASHTVLTGHVTASILRNTLAMVIVILLAVAFGFRPDANLLEWLGTFGLLWIFMLALTWAAATFGLIVKNAEAASSFMFTTMLFPYLTSSFVPINTLPTWIQGFATNQPFNHLVEAIRGLLTNTTVGDHAWLAVVWFGGISAVMYAVARIIYSRQSNN